MGAFVLTVGHLPTRESVGSQDHASRLSSQSPASRAALGWDIASTSFCTSDTYNISKYSKLSLVIIYAHGQLVPWIQI